MNQVAEKVIGISTYENVTSSSEIRLYIDEPGIIGRFLGKSDSIREVELSAKYGSGDRIVEKRHQQFSDYDGSMMEKMRIKREVPNAELDQTTLEDIDLMPLEDMHPRVELGGKPQESKFNLELADPQILFPKEKRIIEGRTLYLSSTDKNPDATPKVCATITEDEDKVVYNLRSTDFYPVGNRGGNEEYLNQILDTIGIDDNLEVLLEEANPTTFDGQRSPPL